MKAIIKIATANRQFTQDQLAIMKRVLRVLEVHNLSIALEMGTKKTKVVKHTLLKIA